MIWKFLTLLTVNILALLAAVAANPAKYCSADLCDHNRTHIGCNNDGQYGKACPKQRRGINITGLLRTLVLETHNKYRNDIAGGKVKNFTSAQRMATMVWDAELEQLALLNAQQCRMQYDCHNTERFRRSGQNIFMAATENRLDVEHFVKLALTTWYREQALSNRVLIATNNDKERAAATHSFVNLVLAGNDRVGCAAVEFRQSMNHFLFVCNYASKMQPHQAIYVSDSVAGSGCKHGTNLAYTHLCAIDEQFSDVR